MIQIRVTEKDKEVMDKLAEEYGISRSEMIRNVVKKQSELYFSQKKVLERSKDV